MDISIDNKKYSLDQHDRDIIGALTRDGRIPFSELAKQVGLSRAVVTARVARMQEIGLIEKFTINLHYSYSRKKTSAYMEILVNPPCLSRVAEEIARHDEIAVVYQMSGGSVLHVHGFFDDFEDIYGFCETKLNAIEGITNIKIEFILKKFKSDFV